MECPRVPLRSTLGCSATPFQGFNRLPPFWGLPDTIGSFTYITDIKNRRVVVADEQKGLVVGFSMFWHRSDVKTVKVKGIPGV